MSIYIIGIVFVIGIVFFIRFMVKNAIQDVNTFYKPFQENAKGKFLDDINFSEAKYALYINHQELGEFMVTDTNALIENQNALQVKTSWVNYLPGEGNRSFGVKLYKDKKMIKSIQGGHFDVFEIGTLNDYAVPVKSAHFNGTKQEVFDQLALINKQENVFIPYQSTLPENDKEFLFDIHFPSVAIGVTRETDGNGNERYWHDYLSDCIRKKAGNITDFEITLSTNTSSDAYLFEVDENRDVLRNKNNQIVYLKDYIFYNFIVKISANETNAKRLLALDYSDCMNDHNRNKAVVLSRMSELIQQSTTPTLSVEKGEVGLEGYRDVLKKSKRLYEQEYSISWFEIKN